MLRDDGTVDHGGVKTSFGGVAPIPTHKLGPKANLGAINAGLRALDRSGKPCKRWEKKGIQIKSFTGVVWELPTWRTPKAATAADTENTSLTGSGEEKDNKGSSQLASERSSTGGAGDMTMNDSIATSSPAPIITTPA